MKHGLMSYDFYERFNRIWTVLGFAIPLSYSESQMEDIKTTIQKTVAAIQFGIYLAK